MKKILTLLGCVAVLLYSTAGAADKIMPFNLQVIQYDESLNAILLSGEYENIFAKPLKAFRADLVITDTQTGKSITLYTEEVAKRLVMPGQWGVWSRWYDFDAKLPEHVFLRSAAKEHLSTQLKLIRVLYIDGSQEGFVE